ncbi:nucleoside deaminase [Aeromicrobium sp.]|uniref:nucleoside deaminase n=1 Tax=Aeromicrobium sp. TaxID=1871063 RepID=UPI0028B0E384|nr:nucleoside deaminase [Aeromicrobium sp.]
MNDSELLSVALLQARKSLDEGGVPIGAALFVEGELLGVGHNMRVQANSAIHHGETNCLENIGRLPAATYAKATMVTTLSPCIMCSGAILLYKIPRVIVGESQNFYGGEDLLRENGVEVVCLNDAECIEMMGDFIANNSDLWHEDIGLE